MNNKEILQTYNNDLGQNNLDLDEILEMVNNLPEAGVSPEKPEQGWYISKTNSSKLPVEITVTGYESLPHVRLQGPLFETIKKVVVDETITSGKDELFRYSNNIEEIEFKSPTGFQSGASSSYNDGSYNVYVFGGCTNLKRIKGGIKTGACYAFSGCTSLIDIDFHESMTVLRPYFFQNCKSLSWDKIPEQFTQIGALNTSNSSSRGHVFEGCENLRISEIPDRLKIPWTSVNTTNVRIPQNMFSGCKNITLSKLPTSWHTIGNYMFDGCEKITISDFTHVKAFGEYALRDCTSITEVVTNGLLELTQTGVFYGCSNLRKAVIKGTSALTSLYSSLFYNCTSLEELELGETITSLGSQCLAYTTSLKKLTLPYIVTCTNTSFYKSGIIQLCLPKCKTFGSSSSTTTAGTLYGTPIKALWFGSTLTTFNRYAFLNNTSIKKIFVDIPRAKLEAMTYYSTRFSNSTIAADVFVCNDDTGFLTQEEFESIDWETYE